MYKVLQVAFTSRGVELVRRGAALMGKEVESVELVFTVDEYKSLELVDSISPLFGSKSTCAALCSFFTSGRRNSNRLSMETV